MLPPIILLPFAVVCLWTPTALVSSPQIRERLRKPARRRDEGIASLARCWLNWVDLARAALGAWLLQSEVLAFRAGQDDTGQVYTVALYAVLFVAVIAQTLWIGRPVRIIGPAFFISGLTVVLCGPMIGIFALLLGFASALVLRRLSLSFAFVPLSLVGFGLIFHKIGAMVIFNAALFALPVLLAFAFGVRVSFVRRRNDAHSGSDPDYTETQTEVEPTAPLANDPLSDSSPSALAAARLHSP
jgi:hypothetical protein